MTDTLTRWIKACGVDMQPVAMFRDGKLVSIEQHIRDPLTIGETVYMAMQENGMIAAVYEFEGRWMLTDLPKDENGVRSARDRLYPSREAAEMVAIHSAR